MSILKFLTVNHNNSIITTFSAILYKTYFKVYQTLENRNLVLATNIFCLAMAFFLKIHPSKKGLAPGSLELFLSISNNGSGSKKARLLGADLGDFYRLQLRLPLVKV